jgi:hypothetical protein
MATQGPLTGGTAATSFFGLDDWTSPSEALASGGSIAFVQKADVDDLSSYYLLATNFGFSLPSATVDGIEGFVRRAEANITGQDDSVMLVVGGTLVGSNQAGVTAFGTYPTFASKTYGSNVSTWSSGALTHTDINASNFGLAWAGLGTSNLGDGFIAIDGITMTVHYTASGGGGPASQTRSFFRKYSV